MFTFVADRLLGWPFFMTTLISLADGIRGLQKELKSRRFELHFVALGKKAGVRAALADACIGPAATADEKPLKKIKPENKKGKGNEKEEEKKEREREREIYDFGFFCTFCRARRWAGGMNYLYALHQVGWRSIVAPSFLSFFFFFFFFFSVSSSTYIYELGYFFEILIFFPIQRRPVFDRGTALCVCVCVSVYIRRNDDDVVIRLRIPSRLSFEQLRTRRSGVSLVTTLHQLFSSFDLFLYTVSSADWYNALLASVTKFNRHLKHSFTSPVIPPLSLNYRFLSLVPLCAGVRVMNRPDVWLKGVK